MPSLRPPSRALALPQVLRPKICPQRRCTINLSTPRWASIIDPLRTSAPPPPPPKRGLFHIRNQIYIGIFLCIGASLGLAMNYVVRPPPHVDSGSKEDEKLLVGLGERIDNLDVMKDMRRSLMLESAEGNGGEWVELNTGYESSNTLVAGSMAGFKGLGVQRAFWNEKRRELVMVVWFGRNLSGWPGLAHGGAIGTVFMEGMEKAVGCVISPPSSSSSDPSTAPIAPRAQPSEPSSLSLTYLKPTQANNMYVLRTQLTEQERTLQTSISPDKDLTKKHHQEGRGISFMLNRKFEVVGSLETINGVVCVNAKATWDIL